MLKQFKKYIEQQKLFKEGDKILLAVSGGIDSVVMAHLFQRAKINFGITHCNFKLRGKESENDEQFVKKIAANYKADFHSKNFNAKKFAEENKISIQMAARDLRYDFFEQTRSEHQYNYIAIAHNADDSAETVLLNLIRGTGIAGYHGILTKNKKIIRPMLFASRDEIFKHVKKNKILWREDSSNKSDNYTRNKIRLKIIPVLKQINPSFLPSVHSHLAQMSEVESLYREYILQLKEGLLEINGNEILIAISKLKKHAAVSTLLFEILKDFGFNNETTKEISENLEGQSGKKYFSPTHKLLKDREHFILSSKTSKKKNTYQIKPDIHFFEWEKNKLTIRKITLTSDLKEKILSGKIRDKNIAYLDADLIKFPLTIRNWEKGDYFYPLGMNGKKLVSDYFIDSKISISKKEKIALLLSANNIVWIMGERADDRYKIKNETGTCLQLTFEKR